MNRERWRQVEAVCQGALECEPSARKAFLANACRGDEDLRREVESLLGEQESAGGLLGTTAWDDTAASFVSDEGGDNQRLMPGQHLGPFMIEALVAVGGMGEVYRARDTRLDRTVAIKVLVPDVAGDPERRRRLEGEARAVSALNHPHICALFDIGSARLPEPGGEAVDYLVMEYLEGETIGDRLGVKRQEPIAANQTSKGLPLPDALEYGIQIADALAAAHSKGIVHRDLKPGNVMLTPAGIKLLDFGLAKVKRLAWTGATAAPSAAAAPRSAAGTILGTASYMAPEQLAGSEADARTDLFAFGALLYEMLTGVRAFDGGSPARVIAAVMEREPVPLSALDPAIPPALDHFVRSCLAKDPNRRWDSAYLAGEELRRIQGGAGASIAGRAFGDETSATPPGRRFRLAAAVAAALALGLPTAALAIWFAVRGADAPPLARFHRLTYQRGPVTSARFMPDGQNILYTARWEGGQQAAFTVRFDGIDSLPQTGLLRTDRPVAPSIAAISRRSEVAFIVDGVLATAVLGGVPRPVRPGAGHADWSPDGAQLAATVGSVLEYPVGTVIHSAPGWTLGDVRISPRGDLLAFRRHRNERGWLDIVDVHGALRAQSSHYEDVGRPVWSPDGREVWFAAMDAGSRHALRAMSLSGHERTIARMPVRFVLHDISREGRVLLATDDTRFSMRARAPGADTERNLTLYSWSVPDDLSEDGRTVLLTEGGESDTLTWSQFLRSTDGQPAQHLGAGRFGKLSPDHRWVATLRDDEQWNDQLSLLPVGPGQPRRLPTLDLLFGSWRVDEPVHGILGWLPDSSGFLFSAGQKSEAKRTWLLRLDGSPPVAVTPAGAAGALLTPDAKSVIAGQPGGRFFLYPVSGGEATPLPGLTPGGIAPFGWSIYGFHDDGKRLRAAVYPTRSAPLQLYLLDPISGRAEPWKQLGGQLDQAGVIFRTVHFTADGTSYVYGYSHTLSALYVVEGWR